MRHKPRKAVGEIGPTKITAGQRGMRAEIVESSLPTNKEDLEAKFATVFVEAFNAQRPCGPTATITNLTQNDTTDLDFRIKSDVADYLELAELNPRSESFGRTMYRTGKFNVYEYARWIYRRIIRKKQIAYGETTAKRTILLLYVTHWQFLPTQNTVMCIRACCEMYGCQFASVILLFTNGGDLRAIEHIAPGKLVPPRKPKDFDKPAANLPPGNHSWTVNLADVAPAAPDE
jgi:hypothetical protein